MTPNIKVEELVVLDSVEDMYLLVAERFCFQEHPYFLWMGADASCEEFLETQLSFRFAVEFFSCALSALVAKIPNLEKRKHVVENVLEEHGEGNLEKSHRNTFIQFLRSLGASEEQLVEPCSVAVHGFNQSIRNFCFTHGSQAGAALLGMIEYLYIDISTQISRKVKECNWDSHGKQEHYSTHEILDVEHAKELFDVCLPIEGKYQKEEIALGMILGAYYFWTLYQDMLGTV